MKGMVAAGHEFTARAGAEMLEAGGNAFDAAVAASFASFVCESVLTSPAGGGFFMAHSKGAGDSVRLYDFFTNVPGLGALKKDLNFFPVYINFAGALQSLHIGEGSAAVPGTVAGLNTVYKNHCTMGLKELLAPAVRYARQGVKLNPCQASFTNILRPMLNASEASRAAYVPDDRLIKEGDLFTNAAMADTFEHLGVEGLERFYDGDIASLIIEGFGEKGLITREDLRAYRVVERAPLRLGYRSRHIFTNPPPSSGGCLIAFALKLLERFDLGALAPGRSEYLKLLTRVMRVTNEARRKDFDHRIHDEGIAAELLSDERLRFYAGLLDGAGPAGAGAEAPPPGTGSTTHISVIDKDGNAASMTTSTGIGCGIMIPTTGIMMNNMLGESDLNPHGFHVQTPGLRMSSMMAPTIVMKDGEPEIVLGSGGSMRIRNAILQVILNIIDHGMGASKAVDAPRIHLDGGGILHVEPGIEEGELGWAAGLGIELNMWDFRHMYFGGVHTVVFEESGAGQHITGAGDSRRGGFVIESG